MRDNSHCRTCLENQWDRERCWVWEGRVSPRMASWGGDAGPGVEDKMEPAGDKGGPCRTLPGPPCHGTAAWCWYHLLVDVDARLREHRDCARGPRWWETWYGPAAGPNPRGSERQSCREVPGTRAAVREP